MLYLYGDETGNPGIDSYFCLGYLITKDPKPHTEQIRNLRKKYNYQREIKYSGTDYSQVLIGIDLIDYFFSNPNLYYKVIIKDKSHFNISYYNANTYGVRPEDLAYVTTYSELTKNVRPNDFAEAQKFCVVDQKPQTAQGILSNFVIRKDNSVVYFEQKGSSDKTKQGIYEGYSEMLQFSDFIVGIVGGIGANNSGKYQNIYKKRFLTHLNSQESTLLKIFTTKNHFYYPSFPGIKFNIYYWRRN